MTTPPAIRQHLRMAPSYKIPRQAVPVPSGNNDDWNWRKNATPEDLVLESWSQGFMVGALMLMSCITIVNIRRGVLLHKLILAEQLMALTHGTFCFLDFNGYGWYLSSTATLLYLSYILHNVVAWMKTRPFFHGKSTIFEPGFVWWTTRIYLTTLAMTVPVILFQITDNFRFFNGYGGWYTRLRPYEPLMRDPWWIFCCGVLFYVVSKSYGMGVMVIIKKSPRFGILFVSIILAVIFTGLDVVCSIHSFIGSTDGINPFWKLAVVFKCLTDAILLDDFKTELKRLGLKRMKRDEKRRESFALTLDDDIYDSEDEARMNYSNGSANGHINPQSLSNGNRPKSNDNLEAAEEVEFMQALNTHPSQLSSDRESRRGSSLRPQIGRGGLPATRLPQLFQAIKPGKRRKQSTEADTEAQATRNDSVWSIKEGEPFESQTKKSKKKARDDDLAPDEIRYEDSTLEEARRMNERTIAELTRRKEGSAGMSTSPDTTTRVGQNKAKGPKNFWDGMDDLDDGWDDDEDVHDVHDGPSSSSSHRA